MCGLSMMEQPGTCCSFGSRQKDQISGILCPKQGQFRTVKFIYSEKATTFFKIFPLLLTTVHRVKSKGKISQNFVAFSEDMNFKAENYRYMT